MMGHNMPPKLIDDFLILDADGDSTGRINITNTIMSKYLVRKINTKQEYVERMINDSEKIGLTATVSLGGTKSFFYQYTPKGDRVPKKHHLGHFPEMKVDAARSLVEDLKQAIKLGQDPRTIIEARRNVKTLSEVITEWKQKELYKSVRYKASTTGDIENRFKRWIDLSSVHPTTNQIILKYRSDLNIGAKKMVEITKDDLVAWHAAISKAGPYQANRIVDDLKVVFKWAGKPGKWLRIMPSIMKNN